MKYTGRAIKILIVKDIKVIDTIFDHFECRKDATSFVRASYPSATSFMAVDLNDTDFCDDVNL